MKCIHVVATSISEMQKPRILSRLRNNLEHSAAAKNSKARLENIYWYWNTFQRMNQSDWSVQ